MSKRFLAAMPLLALFLSNCGGGGSGGGSTIPTQPITQQSTGSAQIKLTIPNAPSSGAQSRSPKFVSSGAQGATIAAGAHGGTLATTTFDLTSSSICQTVSGGRSCTLTVTLPSGNDDINITLYLQAPVSGAIPSGAPILGISTNSNVSIIPGHTASVTAYVLPTISSVSTTSPSMITVAADGTTHTGSVVLNPVDYSNNPIVAGANDPYSNPITVSIAETGGTGHAQVLLNGTPSGTSATVTQSSQTIGIQYDGGGAPGYYATISASATGVSTRSFQMVPMYVTSSSPYFSNGTINFTGPGETATINISEPLGFNTYTATPQTVPSCPNVATVSAVTGSGAAASYTVTSANVAAALSAGCYMIVADSVTATRNVAVTNTLSGGGITIGGIAEYSTPISTPVNIVSGADGLLFVTGPNGASPSTVWTYTTSGAEGNWSSALPATPVATAIGPDKNLWFVTNDVTVYTWNDAVNMSGTGSSLPGGAIHLDGITLGPDSNMWVADTAGAVYALSPVALGGLVSTTPVRGVPNLMTETTTAVWMTELYLGVYELASVVPGSSPTYSTPMPGSGSVPSEIIADSSGNLWVADSVNNAIDEYVPSTTTWNQYLTSVSDNPAGLVFGGDGNIYFTEPGTNQIGELNTTSHAFSHFAIPTTGASPAGITLGADGRIWFTESAPGKIGALTP